MFCIDTAYGTSWSVFEWMNKISREDIFVIYSDLDSFLDKMTEPDPFETPESSNRPISEYIAALDSPAYC